MNRRERRPATKSSRIARNTSKTSAPVAIYEAGLEHFRAGRHLDAQLCCQQALEMDAGDADTLHLMGLLSLHAQQYDHALDWISRAIRQEPKTEYLTNLGITLMYQGRREEAIKTFDKAVQLNPLDADMWGNLGSALSDAERPAEAILSFQQTLKLNPRHWDAAHKCGALLHQLGRLEEALTYFNLCDQIQPHRASTLRMRALTMYGLNRFDEALVDINRAHGLDPANAGICNNTGVFLRRLGREEEALPWFDRALELKPGVSAVIGNKAVALANLHNFEAAFAVFDEMKAADPGNMEIDLDVSLLQLLNGNFEAGWAGREARWKVPGKSSIRHLSVSQPRWHGDESVEGKTILIYADEGLGDSIQFVRYVPMLAARGARVILLIQDALCPVLSRLGDVAQCIPLSAGAPAAFDLYCPISSLPSAFGTRLETIPSTTRYLTAPAELGSRVWQDRLGPHDRLKIGLIWSGNAKHNNDHNRSIPLRTITRMLDVDATFVSLQKDPRPDDKATLLTRSDIVDLSDYLDDFSDTAAVVSRLDLVITVDTSTAHLAGALGRPTWVLLPYTPDFRWLLDRDDSPWYPTVRLFRQSDARDYASVVDRVRSELVAMISARKTC